MKIDFLDSQFAVTDKVSTADLSSIKEQGFRTIICHRRESEEGFEGEQAFAQAADREGLNWVSIPVAPQEYSNADIDAFEKALENAETPILGFCRTGRRAVHMWALSRARDPKYDMSALLKAAQTAGQDPQSIKALLER